MQLITEMNSLQEEKWFAREVTKVTAESWLSDREDGNFLVRLSTSFPAKEPVTISKRKCGASVHRRVGRVSYGFAGRDRYCIESNCQLVSATTIPELLRKLQKTNSVSTVCPHEPRCCGYTRSSPTYTTQKASLAHVASFSLDPGLTLTTPQRLSLQLLATTPPPSPPPVAAVSGSPSLPPVTAAAVSGSPPQLKLPPSVVR
eukprot:TRINITY_DN2580_c0_g1_i1.p3 TRINITY_DN2580_c0_g1~~TRINITY_DN2580_c0_g1_i1.p3  ORF type:complete len:202 (+),score=59.61 TRINITY_DN2580_c0_g1_i1:328-933(+)